MTETLLSRHELEEAVLAFLEWLGTQGISFAEKAPTYLLTDRWVEWMPLDEEAVDTMLRRFLDES